MADETLLQLLKEDLGQQNLLLMSDFNYTGIFWEAAQWCTSCPSVSWDASCCRCWTCHLRSSARLLLTNREDLLGNIGSNGSLGYSDNNVVQFKILLSTLKTSSSTKTLDFRRANQNNNLEPRYKGFHGKHPWRRKELVSAGSYSRTASWMHKSGPFPAKGKAEQEIALAQQ